MIHPLLYEACTFAHHYSRPLVSRFLYYTKVSNHGEQREFFCNKSPRLGICQEPRFLDDNITSLVYTNTSLEGSFHFCNRLTPTKKHSSLDLIFPH